MLLSIGGTAWNVFGTIGIVACVVLIAIPCIENLCVRKTVRQNKQYDERQKMVEALNIASDKPLDEAIETLWAVSIKYENSKGFVLPKFFWEKDHIYSKAKAMITLITFETRRFNIQCAYQSRLARIHTCLLGILVEQAKITSGVALAFVCELKEQAGSNSLFTDFFEKLDRAEYYSYGYVSKG